MGIGIIDNFSLSHTKFLDERQSYPDLATLQANTTVKMPKGMEVYVEDTGKWYVMSCTNADDPTTYVWTERPSGGGASSFSELTGDPMDNTALASALNDKADADDVYTKTEADDEFLSSTDLGSENAGKFIKVANDGSATFGNPTCDPQDIADAVDDYMAEHPISGDSFTDNDIPLIKLEGAVYHHTTNIWNYTIYDESSVAKIVTRGVDLTPTPEGCMNNLQAYLASGTWGTTNGYANGTSDDPSSWMGRLFGYANTDYIEIPETGTMRLNFPVRNFDTYSEPSITDYTYVQANGQRGAARGTNTGSYSSAVAAGTLIDLSSFVANGAKYVRFGMYESHSSGLTAGALERGEFIPYVTDGVNEVEGGEPWYEDYTTLPSDCVDVSEQLSDTLDSAKDYADAQDAVNLVTAKNYADTKDTATLASANTYTDEHLPSQSTLDAIDALIVHDDQHSNNILNPVSLYTTDVTFDNYLGYQATIGVTYDEDQSDPDTAYNADHRYSNRAPYCTHMSAMSGGTIGAGSAASAMANYGCSGSYYVGDLDIPGHWISLNQPVRFWKFTSAPYVLDTNHKNVTTLDCKVLLGSGNQYLQANVWYYIPEDFDIEHYCYMDFGANGGQSTWPQFGGDNWICMRIAPGNLTRQEVEQLTIDVLPPDEYYDIHNVWLNTEVIQDGSIEAEKFNLQEIAEAVPSYISEHGFPANKLEICETHRPSNLVNPVTLTNSENGWFVNGGNWSNNFATYFVGDFIPVPEGVTKFKQNVQARSIGFYSSNSPNAYTYNPENGKPMSNYYISYKASNTAAGEEFTVPAGTKYFRCSYYVSDKSIVEQALYVAASDEYDPEHDAQWYPAYEMIKSEYIPGGSPTPTPSGSSYEEINIANSDKIIFIGDSYTEASHSIENKAYPAKLSMFSDYEFENMAMSGDIYYGQLDKIRSNYARWGTSFLKCNPKYAIMTCYTNDIKTLTVDEYALGLRACCQQVISLGTQPIISTEYHASGGTAQVVSVNDQVARELDCPHWDYTKMVRLIRGSDYAPFWGGSHPGPRTNAIESDNMEKYLETLERPRKSLKFYRLRDFMSFDPEGDMTNLVYWNNEERAEKFKEIHVSHSVIQDPTMVDNITNASTTGQTSEYAIMQDGGNCSFHRAGIMDVVIPGTYKTTEDLYFTVKTNGAEYFKCYALDSLAGSYARPQYMLRVDLISSLCTNLPQVDDQYNMTPELNGATTTLTIKSIAWGIADGAADMTLFCYVNGAPMNRDWTVSDTTGNLAKVSGQGDDNIAYTYRCKSYDTQYLNDMIIGGWTELEGTTSGSVTTFRFPENTPLKRFIHRDKVSFLFTNANGSTNVDFSIAEPKVFWLGHDDKTYDRKKLNFLSNVDNTNTELFDYTQPGTAGTADANFGGLTPISVYDSCYPYGCSSAVVINDQDKFTIELSTAAKNALKIGGTTAANNTTSTEAILEVWARYFPDIYTDGSGNQITGDSYDYATLKVDMVASNEKYTATLSQRVNTHWKIVQLPIHVSGAWDSAKLRFYANKDLQIAKISLKLREFVED